MTATLYCDFEVRRGPFELRAQMAVEPGEVVGIIGANGSGKSSMLGAIAGTLALHAGSIVLGERTLSSRSADRRQTFIPRASRRVGLLDQRARLFPHLDATANIAFGPRSQGKTRKTAAASAQDWLKRIGLESRGAARENELSGGQQQRIAIARTLAAEPQVLLLDEPFAALDVASSHDLRRLLTQEIRRLNVPTVLVTHDPIDLVALADRVMVIEEGRIAQHGSLTEVITSPTSDFAAEFSGRALIRGESTAQGALQVDGAPVSTIVGRRRLSPAGRPAIATFDPSAVMVEPLECESAEAVAPFETGGDEASLMWVGTVAHLSSSRTGVRVECVEWPAFFAEVPVSRAAERRLQPGSRVRLTLPVDQITLTLK